MSQPINGARYFEGSPSQVIAFDSVAEWKHTLLKETYKKIQQQNFIPKERQASEVTNYFGRLQLEDEYFIGNKSPSIASHITSLYSAKIIAETTQSPLQLNIKSENEDSTNALFIVRSTPGAWNSPSEEVEKHIDDHYLGQNEFGAGYAHRTERLLRTEEDLLQEKRWNVSCFRTGGSVSASSGEENVHLRFYFLTKPIYKSECDSKCHDLDKIGDVSFLAHLAPEDQKYFQELVSKAHGQLAPIFTFRKTKDNEVEIVAVLRAGSTHSFFGAMSRVYHTYGYQSSKKQAQQLANGFTIIRMYIYPADKKEKTISIPTITNMMEDFSTVYALPRTSLTPLVKDKTLNIKEHAYAYAAWKFAFHFLGRQSQQFKELSNILKDNTLGLTLLDEIRGKVKKEAYTEQVILPAIFEKPDVVKVLYQDFENYHSNGIKESLSDRVKKLTSFINDRVRDDLHRTVFNSFVSFNINILKTNFYSSNKVAICFRLNPSFLSVSDYPQTPYGIFFMVGAEFRGFHVRFRDVARGGIRMVKSLNPAAFSINASTFFDEVYNLANTQERKNKDIAEGGSKGAILLQPDHQDRAQTAFHKFVDALLDLLIVSSETADYFKKEELLFLGPDEGTADLMDLASEHAKMRGYKYWKAFTTGKSPIRGGIPHDTYGMTTRSVHQYVIGILNKLGLKENEMSKFQTGGPDGDLGSNEIKISKDKTIGIVDGSGVLYDPEGINREALLGLANRRVMTNEFPKEKISKKGFYISINDTNVKLPDGNVISNGTEFRNSFHLSKYAKADMFVPCGGRPESINLGNVHNLFDFDKTPHWKIIVEGANLFITQQARIILENAGVILIKDASANKGGVTSSSLEVQAALALTDEEFEINMSVKDKNNPPEFYVKYKDEVQDIIEKNAAMEFNCLWNESQKSDTPKSILSDQISNKINELSLIVGNSQLWDNISLRKKVLEMNTPKEIIQLVGGLDNLMKRIPESYLRAVFSCTLSAHYVYSEGLPIIPEFNFYNFLNKLL